MLFGTMDKGLLLATAATAVRLCHAGHKRPVASKRGCTPASGAHHDRDDTPRQGREALEVGGL
jgi:hypothetical protein